MLSRTGVAVLWLRGVFFRPIAVPQGIGERVAQPERAILRLTIGAQPYEHDLLRANGAAVAGGYFSPRAGCA